MIIATDVYYRDDLAVAAGVLFNRWDSDQAVAEVREVLADVAAYEPGAFYKRELPCLLGLLNNLDVKICTIIVDGYVWLGPEMRPGLGAHLYASLGQRIPVIGVAKSAFKGSSKACPVLRGGSGKPLYVTAAGIDPRVAARNIQEMHGPHRIPTLLKKVDQLCRRVGRWMSARPFDRFGNEDGFFRLASIAGLNSVGVRIWQLINYRLLPLECPLFCPQASPRAFAFAWARGRAGGALLQRPCRPPPCIRR